MLVQNVFASVTALQARRMASTYTGAHFQILAGAFVVAYFIFGGYALLSWQQISLASALAYAPQIILSSVAFTIWNALTFLVFRYVDAAIGSLFTTLNLVAVVIISSLTINETLTSMQLVGAVVLFAAILIVLLSHLSKAKRHRWEIGLILTIIGSLAFGAAIASEKYLLDQIGLPTYGVFGFGVQVFMLVILALLFRPKHFALYKNSSFVKNVIGLGVVRAGAGLLFVIALVMADNASLVGVLSGLKIIITAILAGVFLHETQLMGRKLVAAMVAFVGVGLMMW
jgi:hypothetical protein